LQTVSIFGTQVPKVWAVSKGGVSFGAQVTLGMNKLAIGEVVGGYRIQRFLGRGGFSSVYLGEHPETKEKAALKFGNTAGGGPYVTRLLEVSAMRSEAGISPDETPGEAVFTGPEGARVDFLDKNEIDAALRGEARLLGRVVSPNVVKLRSLIEHEGRPVVATEHVRGKTLREKIRNLEGIHLNWFLAITRALIACEAEETMAYHGDLKPENIIVKPSGKVVMIDPAFRNEEGDLYSATPFYNPLLLKDAKADVMAIGIMIYEILTGTLPFEEVPWKYAGQKAQGETIRLSLSYFMSYVPPHVLNPKTPDGLEDIVYRCITVPEYLVEDLRRDLEAFIGQT
jgi:serine/threonine protein kinase